MSPPTTSKPSSPEEAPQATPTTPALSKGSEPPQVLQVSLLVLAAGLILFANLGSYGLFDVDEPRYAETARSMVTSGDYVFPRLNGEPRLEKPPLVYWMIAGAYVVLGVNEWSARLPSALAALLLVLITYAWARRFWGWRVGLLAGLVLVTTVEVAFIGRLALTDMGMTLFVAGAMMAFHSALEEAERYRRWAYLGFAALGLALLQKGPVGIALPVLTVGLYLLLTRRLADAWRKLPLLRGAILAGLIALPWYVAISLRTDGAFPSRFFLEHNLSRFVGELAQGQHVQPFYYYLPVLLAGGFPWAFFYPWAVWRSWRLDRTAVLYPLVWTAVVLGFFTLSQAKLPTYILPLYPPLAVLVGRAWADVIDRGPDRGFAVSSLLLVAVLLGLAIVSALFPGLVEPGRYPLGRLPLAFAALFGAWGAGLLLALGWRRGREVFAAVAVGGFAFLLAGVLLVYPRADAIRQAPMRHLARQAGTLREEGATVVAYRLHKPGLVFYSRGEVVFWDWPGEELVVALDTLGPVAVLAEEEHLRELRAASGRLEVRAVEGPMVLLASPGLE